MLDNWQNETFLFFPPLQPPGGTSKPSSKVLYFDGGYVYSTNAQSLIRYLVNLSNPAGTGKDITGVHMFIDYIDLSDGEPGVEKSKVVSLTLIPNADETKTAYSACGQVANNGKMRIKKCTFSITSPGGNSTVYEQNGPSLSINPAQTMMAHIEVPLNALIDTATSSSEWMAFYYYPSDVTFESSNFGSGRIMYSTSGNSTTYTYQYFLTDHIGSTRMVVDRDGNPLEEINYYPYGTMVPVAPPANPELLAREKFTGKEFDTEGEDVANGAPGIQCYYFGARYYDPEIGVWGTRDAAGQFWSGYGYAGNPVLYVDPDGNWFLIDDLIAAGVGFAVGYVGYGLSTGNWGGRAAMYGAIGAGAAWLTWNTGGAAAAASASFWGAVGHAAVGGAVGGAFTGAANYTEAAAYGTNGYSMSNLQENWNLDEFALSTTTGAVTGAATAAAFAGVSFGVKSMVNKWGNGVNEARFADPQNEIDEFIKGNGDNSLVKEPIGSGKWRGYHSRDLAPNEIFLDGKTPEKLRAAYKPDFGEHAGKRLGGGLHLQYPKSVGGNYSVHFDFFENKIAHVFLEAYWAQTNSGIYNLVNTTTQQRY